MDCKGTKFKEHTEKLWSSAQELWETILDQNLNPEVRARVNGVKSQMQSFDYYFGICIGELILKHADNLSKTLQSSTISAAEGQQVAGSSVATLAKLRSDEQFSLFWESIKIKALNLEISEPCLVRMRKGLKRFETGFGEPYYPPIVEEYYRRHYFEIIDLAISSIKSRFDQPGYAIYRTMESLVLKSILGESSTEELEAVTSFFGKEEISASTLELQLQTLATQFGNDKQLTLHDVVSICKHFYLLRLHSILK